MTEKELEEWHNKAYFNKDIIEKANICGCFYCRNFFYPIEIREYCDRGKTALCPRCGIDAILPLEKQDSYILEEMYKHWFNQVWRIR